jgi:hypothetical protein
MAPVRETEAMIAQMSPELRAGTVIYCTTRDNTLATRCLEKALCMFDEEEGRTFILPIDEARQLGFDTSMPMRRITLTVHSALDGVGLTAAVSAVLAGLGIPCNIVAAYHHDHLFVPESAAAVALEALATVGQTTGR